MKRLNTVCLIVLVVSCFAACKDSDVILPGKREPISNFYKKTSHNFDKKVENRSLAFRPPKKRLNKNWVQGNGSPMYRTSNPALSQEANLFWSTQIGAGDSKRVRITADLVVSEGKIFTLDSQMVLTATSNTGKRLWSKDLTPKGERTGQADGGGLALGGKRLFVSTGYGILYSLDPKTGKEYWRQSLLGSGNSQPAYHKGLVYLISNDTTSWAIEAQTGRIKWQKNGLADRNNLAGSVGPAVSEKLVIFGFGSGEIQAVFRQGGTVLWKSNLSAGKLERAVSTVEDMGTTPVIDGNLIFAANSSGMFTAFDLESGKRKWTAPFGVRSMIWPAGNSLFFVDELGYLTRLLKKTGALVWRAKLPGFLELNRRKSKEIVTHHGPILAGDLLYLASGDGMLRQYDPKSGNLLQKIEIPGGATTNPVVVDRILYVVSKTGELHAYR